MGTKPFDPHAATEPGPSGGLAGMATGTSEPPRSLAIGSTRPAGDVVGGSADVDAFPLVEVDRRYYMVDRELARGGMGRVLVARDRRLARTVAIKELLVDDAGMRARFEREARITARLQHPSTVALIEAGTWPGGSPFFAMNLVIGEPLEKVIAGHPTLASRLGLIPNVIAAADALAYAHDRRIIHRDLKPANVLVGRYGQTIVVDWGLAKDLTSATDELAAEARPSRQTLDTMAGTVMGTPAYMPPEQAEGEPVDERADVYSLGAMLYHVLAGTPPYTGRTADAVLDAVLAGPPRSLAAIVPDVPPELVTIVDKAMARDRSNRYANASELVAELKQFQTGAIVGSHRYSLRDLVRRWLRKNKTTVAIGAIATLVVAVVSVVSLLRVFDARRNAEAAQHVAEMRRADADKLLDFMLTDLKAKLQPLGKLELLGAVADKASTYFEARSTSTADARQRQFKAWMDLGDVVAARGELTGSLVHHRKALALALRMLALDGHGVAGTYDVSAALEAVASTLMAQGDHAGAGPLLAMQRHLLQRQLDVTPLDNKVVAAMVKNRDEQATLAAAAGDRKAEIRHLEAARDLATERVKRSPEDWIAQVDLVALRMHLSDALTAGGTIEPAVAELRTAVAEGDRLASIDPSNAGALHARTVAYAKLGDALARAGDAGGSFAARETALALANKLAAHDPSNVEWQRIEMIASDHLSDAHAKRGNVAEAIARLRRSQAIAQHIVDLDSTNAVSRRDLSVNHVHLARLLRATGDLDGAEHELVAGVAIADALASDEPGNVARQRDSAVGASELGDLKLARKDATGALAQYRAGHAIIERLAAADPTDVRLQRMLSIGHEKVGDALIAAGKHAEALAAYKTALSLAQKLAATDPDNAGWSSDVMEVTTVVAQTLEDAGNAADAKAAYADALAIARRLAAMDPEDAEVKQSRDELAAKVKSCCKKPRRKRR